MHLAWSIKDPAATFVVSWAGTQSPHAGQRALAASEQIRSFSGNEILILQFRHRNSQTLRKNVRKLARRCFDESSLYDETVFEWGLRFNAVPGNLGAKRLRA